MWGEAQGRLGQGMRRGMYPGGGNWHCRGPARAGLACCHRSTWVWWEGGGKGGCWGAEGERFRRDGWVVPLPEPTVETIIVVQPSWWIPGGKRHPTSHLPLLRSVLVLSKQVLMPPSKKCHKPMWQQTCRPVKYSSHFHCILRDGLFWKY